MKVQFEIDAATRASVEVFVATTRDSEHNTHGPLSVAKLAQMLIEDVALMVDRPGCWEATNMFSLLASHGYEY